MKFDIFYQYGRETRCVERLGSDRETRFQISQF